MLGWKVVAPLPKMAHADALSEGIQTGTHRRFNGVVRALLWRAAGQDRQWAGLTIAFRVLYGRIPLAPAP